jgi:hypothetical protein
MTDGWIGASAGGPTQPLGHGCCPACRTCIRMHSSARWRAGRTRGPGRRQLLDLARNMYGFAAARSIRTPCRRLPRSSTSKCSRPATPRSANFITCIISRTARLTRSLKRCRCADRGGARSRHRADLAAGAVHERRFRWSPAIAAAAPLRSRVDSYLRLLASLRKREAMTCAWASRCIRCVRAGAGMRAVLASEAAKNWPDPHPYRRADRRSAGLPRHARCAAGRVAARSRRRRYARWCLVHATHLTEAETSRIARSGAVAGLCPTTEANLGDGLFPLARLPRCRWRARYRFGFAHLHLAGGRVALARIRPAAADAASQYRCAACGPAWAKHCGAPPCVAAHRRPDLADRRSARMARAPT